MAIALLCRPGHSLAGTAMCAATGIDATRVGSHDGDRTTIDPATNARTVVRRDADGRVAIELIGTEASIRKVLDGHVSITTLATAAQQIVITIAGDDVAMTIGGRTWRASAKNPESLGEAVRLLRASKVGQSAKALVDRASLAPDSVGGQALMLTRALLGSLWGETWATVEHQRWVRATIGRVHIAKAAMNDGPGDCWDRYAAEAIRIADDYISCGNSCKWGGVFCMAGCGFLYEVRSEAAFMWFTSCNGKFFVG